MLQLCLNLTFGSSVEMLHKQITRNVLLMKKFDTKVSGREVERHFDISTSKLVAFMHGLLIHILIYSTTVTL